MKIWTFTTTNNDELKIYDMVTLKRSLAKHNIEDWLNIGIKKLGEDRIEMITIVITKDQVTSNDYTVKTLKPGIKLAQKALDDPNTESVKVVIETSSGNYINALTTAFSINDKHIPKKFIVQGAEYNEPNGTLIPFAVTRPNYYAACKWVVNDFNNMAKKADRPERLTLKEVMEKHGATSPDSWGTNSWVKYTIAKEK